jgi:hypothetical protein
MREGRWDCASCGAVGNLGRHVSCAGCGLPRPQGVRFYLPEDAEAVTDAALLAQAHAGADWICRFCAASNRDALPHCGGCGAPREQADVQAVTAYDEDEIPRSGRRAADAHAPPPAPKRGWSWRKRLGVAAGVAFAAVVGLLTLGGLLPEGWDLHPAQVVDRSWERTVAVERYRTVREDDWQVPAGGRLVSSRREVRRYERVLDHYETKTRQVSERVQTGTRTYSCGSVDRGNGYFEDRTCTEPTYETRYRTETYQDPVYRQEPVYGTKYVYDIDRWMPERTERAAGAEDEPRWPAVTLRQKEREAGRKETYVVRFRDDDGETRQAELPLERWSGFRAGERAALRYPLGGGVLVLPTDSLPACRKWAEKPGGPAPPDSLGCRTPAKAP